MTTEPAAGPETPLEESLSFFDNPAVQENPYPVFAGMRANAPVMQFGPLGLWLVTKYDDVVRVLRDPETFSSQVGVEPADDEVRSPSILFDDPPIHTRMRGLISKAFTPRVIALQRDTITENCEAMIASMCAKDTADIVAELAYPLPVMVIANMLGVQDGDMATFKRWSDAIIENVGAMVLSGDQSGVAEINVEFDAYFMTQIRKLREHREDNLLSELIHAETEDGHLSNSDLLVICRVLLVAGNETTTGLIVNAVRAFSEFPDEMTRLRENPHLIPSACEEVLRFYAPFPGTFRKATRDVELSGVTIPAGARVIPLMASANRDESQFDNPDEFRIDRDPNRHVGFGMGIHYCLGAPLARLEGEIAINILLRHVKAVTIVESVAGELMRPGGPKELHVTFDLDPAYTPA